MLKNALERFGLVNIKKHEIKTLIKVFKSEVNFDQENAEEEILSESDEKSKTLSLMFDDPSEEKVDLKAEKKDKFDIED